MRLNADNTLAGTGNGKALTGNWKISGGYFCFDRALGGKALPSDCVAIFQDGTNLARRGRKGEG
jgi:hypothetical protein